MQQVAAACCCIHPSYSLRHPAFCLSPLHAVFYGPVTGMQPYFEGLGFIFPLQQNPADACMDIVSGAALRPGQVRSRGVGRVVQV